MVLLVSQTLREMMIVAPECTEDLQKAVIPLLLYYVWFSVRNLLVTLCAYFTNHPLEM